MLFNRKAKEAQTSPKTSPVERPPYKVFWFTAKNQTELIALINKLNPILIFGEPLDEERQKEYPTSAFVSVVLRGGKLDHYLVEHRIDSYDYNRMVESVIEDQVRDKLLE